MLKLFVALIIYFFAAIYITFPLLLNFGKLSTGIGDELVIAWIQNWVMHSYISGSFLTIFEANLYFPHHNTLAFSDTFFISSLIALIPRLLMGEPIVAVNITLFLSLIFLGFSMYCLANYVTKDYLVSIFTGLLVIFCPAVLSFTTHVQMLAITGVPFAILFYLKFLDSQRIHYFVLSLLCFLLQTYNSFLPGYFIVFALAIITLVHWFRNRKVVKKLVTKKIATLLLITFLLLLLVIIPYYQVSQEFNYVRDIRDAIHFALQPEDLLYPSIYTRMYEVLKDLPINQFSQNNEFKPGYLGVVFSVLVLFSVMFFFRNKKKHVYTISFFIIAIVGLLVSLGPVLHLGRQTIHYPFPIPLPYALLYYVSPGFQGFRNSARWEMLFILAIAIVIAIVLHTLLKKYSLTKRAVILSILTVGVMSEFAFPMQLTNLPQKEQFPKVYSWLSETPNNTIIIEMPVHNWNSPFVQEELWREYYGTIHFRRTVNGYTGFSPPPWQELVQFLNNEFPNNKSIDRLRSIKINYIIVHVKQVDELYKAKKTKVNGKQTVSILRKNNSLKQVKQFDDTYVFEVLR